MRNLLYSEVHRAQKELSDGEIFMIRSVRNERSSPFIITTDAGKRETIGLGVKIKGKVYMSEFFDKGDPHWKAKMDTCMKQVVGVKAFGWHRTGEKMYDSDGYQEDEFKCAYCGLTTTNPQSHCVCRRIDEKI